ncbi:Acyl-CoA hydrolase [Quadrisphaera granulorum]|uniref:Acyl-CoA hydrolase n=1 Tax=Quadrisphaera granulorum TaxID=317664 RepID=A0A316ADJ5_9ACTN|nr:acyl-CoA thioesterase [Quadrisphaera granulorum]PWJ55691.1 acyl-CoA hydrolase [Quadrisphaera granulorum]SZE95188.1 Acyl-CoA hydrolase [Quadrisphaera granulorum]
MIGSVEGAEDVAPISFRTRTWVRPEHLNANGTTSAGSIVRWVDEEASIYAFLQLGSYRVVTKLISSAAFSAPAQVGDLIELGLRVVRFGRTSLTLRAEVRNMVTREEIVTIDEIVFVNLGDDGRPAPHGYTEVTYARDRVPRHRMPAAAFPRVNEPA